jgi:hypothetical protein
MNHLIRLKTTAPPVLMTLTLLCLGLLPRARAVLPAPDGGYPSGNTGGGLTSEASTEETVLQAGSSHGRLFVSPDALLRIAKPRKTVLSDEAKAQESEGQLSGKAAPCGKPVCGESAHVARKRRSASPPPTTPAYTCVDHLDPQIAASNKSFLVIGMRDHVLFYDKGGKPLYPKPSLNGPQVAGLPDPYGPVYLCDLFAPIIPDANAHLGLPTTKKDHEGHWITVENGYGINCNKATGGVEPPDWQSDRDFYWPVDELYDARVLWDEYNKRFWIGALLKNSNTVAYSDPAKDDPMMLRPATRSANVRSARRALLAIAVSKTEDPRDGWYVFWVYGVPGQEGCPASKECVGFGSDYLSMGISSKYLTLESSGSAITDQSGRQVITIVPTAPLVEGSGSLIYQPDPRPFDTRLLQPAVQHKPDFDDGKEVLLAAPVYDQDNGLAGNTIQLSIIAPQAHPYNGVPLVYRQLMRVRRFQAIFAPPKEPATEPQKGGTIGVSQNWVNKLVYRNSSLYMTFDECRSWNTDRCLKTAVRYVHLDLIGLEKVNGKIELLTYSTEADRTIGDADTEPDKAFSFGFPAVEVNHAGDAVLSYDGTSPQVFPQARYRVWLGDEDDIRSSQVLKRGAATVHSHWHHYLGMSVDSFDDMGIWMINGYADTSTNWGYAFGKVLGNGVADLAVLQSSIEQTSGGDTPGYRLSLVIQNLGDGAAPATSVRLFLARRGSPELDLKSVELASLGPGRRTKHWILNVTTPAGAVAGGYLSLGIELDAKNKLRQEYDKANNTSFVTLPIT